MTEETLKKFAAIAFIYTIIVILIEISIRFFSTLLYYTFIGIFLFLWVFFLCLVSYTIFDAFRNKKDKKNNDETFKSNR